MVVFNFLQLFALGLALASPALACVQYSCNIDLNNGLFNAALTDNGGQKCQLANYNVGKVKSKWATIDLSCVATYSATFDSRTGVVTYAYPAFSGSFATTESTPSSGVFYWTANVFGC